MREAFSLRTVRKKMLMLSKLAGLALLFSYGFFTRLPLTPEASFLLWFGFVLLLILAMDFLMGRFISKPVSELNDAAKRMASLDFSTPCSRSSLDEFGELAASLNAMAENLQQALGRLEDANTQLKKDVEKERLLLSERKELVDNLSHAMKTPLGVIRAYAEGLQDEPAPTIQQKYIQVIISETQRMNDLIQTLLDLSALETGASRLQISLFDFVELAETVAGRLLLDAPDANFQLEYELPDQKIFVESDRRRMEQVLENLLINARKNVRPGGVLRLALIPQDGFLQVSVFNQGRPIPPEDLPRIWEKFYRAGGAYHGSGLGLSIVAQICSMQNLPFHGENLANGVRFSFSIPIAK